jgi:hypothetical protein
MAFQDTSYSVIIDAVLTDAGRKKMATGKFEVTKFSFGDDEIDYSLQDSGSLIEQLHTAPTATTEPNITLTASAMYEAFGSKMANIQYGLISYPNQNILYMPVLKLNTKHKVDVAVKPGGGWAATSPTGSVIYLSANEETTNKINTILSSSFGFLEASSFDTRQIIIESGLDTIPGIPSEEAQPIDYDPNNYGLVNLQARDYFLCRYGLLDYNFHVAADTRFIDTVIGTRACDCMFKNYANGTAEMNFVSSYSCSPTSIVSPFETHKTFVVQGVDNLIIDHHPALGGEESVQWSSLRGPKGTITGINLSIYNDLKVNSAGVRNYRYTNYGEINQKVFDDTHKFDYIDTALHIVGTATQAQINVPLRIIRYAGK